MKQSDWFKKNTDGDIYKMSLSDVNRSETWVSCVNKFIDKVLSEKKYVLLLKDMSLTKNDLIDIYLLMTIATLPNPIFKTGKSKFGYTLVPSVMYQEINKQLKEFLGSLSFQPENDWEQGQFGFRYATHCITFAKHLKKVHENVYGKIKIDDV